MIPHLTHTGLTSTPLTTEQRTALVEAYQLARTETDRAATDAPGRCRYCGAHRLPIPGSTIDGHALCVVPAAFMAHVLNLVETGASMAEVRTVIGVSKNVLQAWCREALERRAHQARSRGGVSGLEPWVRMAAIP